MLAGWGWDRGQSVVFIAHEQLALIFVQQFCNATAAVTSRRFCVE